MALINVQQKWIYLFEPHTASRATDKLLREEGGASTLGHHHIDVDELTNWRREHISTKDIKEYQIICTIRNPFDVLITKWRVSPGRNGPFEKWAWDNRDHVLVATPLRGLWKSAEIWCYYEDLEEDLRWVFGRRTNDPKNDDFRLPYNQAHKTQGKNPWTTYFKSDDSKRIMEYLMNRQYGGFMKRFGYNIDIEEDGRMICNIDKRIRAKLTQQIKVVQGF